MTVYEYWCKNRSCSQYNALFWVYLILRPTSLKRSDQRRNTIRKIKTGGDGSNVKINNTH